MPRNATNKLLHKAKKSKSDEFYTQYIDIQKEIESYLAYNADVFRDKVVYCNCDDPFESNFFRYFVLNFKRIGLKKLITTSYKPSPVANTKLELFSDYAPPKTSKGRPKVTANKFIINEVGDIDGDGEFSLKDVALQLKRNKNNEWSPLINDGDFRSDESINLLKQSDIVVTNPPFSLFPEFIKQLIDHDKKFLIIGNINAITYKEVFPLIKSNKVWLGTGMGRWISGFIVPENYDLYGTEARIDEEGNRIVATNNCLWLTNIDHGKRHQPLPLMSMSDNIKFSSHKNIKGKGYRKYDNFDAIEVPYTDAIPSDYDGVMGVPITFLDKYNPDQFEILGCSYDYGRPDGWNKNINMSVSINGENIYKRILIKHKRNGG
ncbi:putative adenine-specific methylase [Arenimonas maotaiensis]|uniref:Adenine-specific methylase n=1 Tax=Arenimonas maotaiensis TaxID=1446479 RepID=A0A917FMH1_9GAMM|nr:adenine-specific methyltransferase EcoRI family protein [Arenimonas maotaiensis]GGF89832.1 putative adenine-specific methylase [Arenimonas maotaiensis]